MIQNKFAKMVVKTWESDTINYATTGSIDSTISALDKEDSNYYEKGIKELAKFLDTKSHKNKYKILHLNLSTEEQRHLIADYNKGKYKILLLHPNITEGVTLKATRQLHILEPVFNNQILKQISLDKFDYVFLDGGHKYETVKDDLELLTKVINNTGIILCDDYDLTYAPGVKKAIDEYVYIKKLNLKILHSRFAEITR